MAVDFHDSADAASLLVVVGAVSEILPPIAAGLAIIWTLIRIYEWFRFRVLGITKEAIK